MKFLRFLPLLILFGLIAAPDAAFSAASEATLLWWTRVLPSLLPYLVAASLLGRSDLLSRFPNRFAPFLLLPLGALGGYPVGARLSGSLYRDGVLTLPDARKAAAFCNLPNPVFLISVVSAGIFRSVRTAAPLLIGVYGAALLGLIPLSRLSFSEKPSAKSSPQISVLPAAIEDGVRAVLIILGCMIFASVLGSLTEATGILFLFGSAKPVARAVLLSIFELTCGASKIAALPLSLPVRLALCAFFIQLGGVSVVLQSASALPLSVPRFLLTRLLLGAVSSCTVFLLTPLFCPDAVVPTFASGAQMLQNSLDLLSVSFAAGFGLLLVFVFTFGLSKRKRTP